MELNQTRRDGETDLSIDKQWTVHVRRSLKNLDYRRRWFGLLLLRGTTCERRDRGGHMKKEINMYY